MTEQKETRLRAKDAFEKTDYASAFSALWNLGVEAFFRFGENQSIKIKKEEYNWFSHPDSASYFWNHFAVKDIVFKKLFDNEHAEHILHMYFCKWSKYSPTLESKLAEFFPTTLINSVRFNQVFLDENRLEHLLSLTLPVELRVHQETWKALSDIDSVGWKNIQKAYAKVKEQTFAETLSYSIIWLETLRFKYGNRNTLNHLSAVYNFFMELMLCMNDNASLNVNSISKDFPRCFNESISNPNETKYNNVKALLQHISIWINFEAQMISPYCFDKELQPIKEKQLIYLTTTPESHYKWLVDGSRYLFTELNYRFQGYDIVDALEEDGEIVYNFKTEREIQIAKDIASREHATLKLLHDLGISSIKIGETEMDVQSILHPILSFTSNQAQHYEINILSSSTNSSSWIDAHKKLILNTSIDEKFKKPYFLNTQEELTKLFSENLIRRSDEPINQLVKLFTYKSRYNLVFNRFRVNCDVWRKPFVQIGEHLFCPLMFLSSNGWFYSFIQIGLRNLKTKEKERGETRQMEQHLGEIIRHKKWSVKVIDEKESSIIDGDVDIIVEDGNDTLFIQLKRTYFRINLKDEYFESIHTDKKAALQLNLVEKFFEQNDTIYKMIKNPVKWIVSTSFENIGSRISDCLKVNYFEFINAINNPSITSLKELFADIEGDINLKKFSNSIYNPDIGEFNKWLINETGLPIKIFSSSSYKYPIFSNDELVEYNKLYELANKLLNENEYDESLRLLNECSKTNDKDGDVWFAKATLFADTKQFELAVNAFNKSLECLPNNPLILRDYAIFLKDNGYHFESCKLFVDLVKKYPLLADLAIQLMLTLKEGIQLNRIDTEQTNYITNAFNRNE